MYYVTLWLLLLGATKSVICSRSLNIVHPKWMAAPRHATTLPGRYIVELEDMYDKSPTEFVSDFASDVDFNMTLGQDLHSAPIFRGLSVHFHHTEASGSKEYHMAEHRAVSHLLKSQPVKRVYPVTEVLRPITFRSSVIDTLSTIDNLPFSHAMSQVDKVHNELGLTGKGVVVGIIDTGVDYYHPALGGGFGPGFKVALGADLVGDAYNVSNPESIKPSDTPYDNCPPDSRNGHGTHVAGIIGAQSELYNFTGVAPEATLGMWRVFGCNGSSSNDFIIKALIMAYEAGCNVINLSLGDANSWPEDPVAVVASRLTSKNVMVVCAAGNDGVSGAYMVSSPSDGNGVISVASIDNSHSLEHVLTTSGGQNIPYILSSSTDAFPNGTLVAYSTGSTNADACNGTVAATSIEGAIALIKRGTCLFDEKAQVAKQQGAIGVLVYDTSGYDVFQPSTDNATIPVAGISFEDGMSLLAELSKANNRVQIFAGSQLVPVPIHTSGQISKFSSFGPTYELGLKPDLAAIGGRVFSTLPRNQGSYGTLSGTSMASPFVAGCSALLLQAFPNMSHFELLSRLQSTGKLAIGNNSTGLDNPVRQGGGLVQAYDAIKEEVLVLPSSIEFNDTARLQPKKFAIKNTGKDTVVYTIQNVPSLAIAPYNTDSETPFTLVQPAPFSDPPVSVQLGFSTDTLTLAPGESKTVTVSVTQVDQQGSETQPFPIYGGYVALVSENRPTRHIPYAGVLGNVSTLPIFDQGFPLVTSYKELLSFEGGNQAKYTINRNDSTSDAVIILNRLVMGTARLVTEVLDSEKKLIGTVSNKPYMARNTLNESNFINTSIWRGTFVSTNMDGSQDKRLLGEGTYYLRWRALRLLSDPRLPSSWEVVTSAPIVIL